MNVETATLNRDGEVESKRRASAYFFYRAVRLSHPYISIEQLSKG